MLLVVFLFQHLWPISFSGRQTVGIIEKDIAKVYSKAYKKWNIILVPAAATVQIFSSDICAKFFSVSLYFSHWIPSVWSIKCYIFLVIIPLKYAQLLWTL